MPRRSAIASSVIALSGAPLPPPAELTAEEAEFWHRLVDPFPPERFGPDDGPALTELAPSSARAPNCRTVGRDAQTVSQQADAARGQATEGFSAIAAGGCARDEMHHDVEHEAKALHANEGKENHFRARARCDADGAEAVGFRRGAPEKLNRVRKAPRCR